MEAIYTQYASQASFTKKRVPKYDLSIKTDQAYYDDALELQQLQKVLTPQPRKLVCPSPAGPPPQNFFKFDSADLKDSKARQVEDEIKGIFFRDFDSSGIEVSTLIDELDSENSQNTFFKRLAVSPCATPTRDITTPVPIAQRRPSAAANRLASPFPMGTPPGRAMNPVPLNSPFVDNMPIGAELGLLSLSPPVNRDDVILQHKRVNAVMNRQRSLSLGDNPRAILLGKA
jgi:hypothetical protein